MDAFLQKVVRTRAELEALYPRPPELVLYLGRKEFDDLRQLANPLNILTTPNSGVTHFDGMRVFRVAEESHFNLCEYWGNKP